MTVLKLTGGNINLLQACLQQSDSKPLSSDTTTITCFIENMMHEAERNHLSGHTSPSLKATRSAPPRQLHPKILDGLTTVGLVLLRFSPKASNLTKHGISAFQPFFISMKLKLFPFKYTCTNYFLTELLQPSILVQTCLPFYLRTLLSLKPLDLS